MRSSQRSDRRTLSSAAGGGASSGKKSAISRLSMTDATRALTEEDDPDSGRVRVAVRVRPKNDEEISHDSEFIDCLELQPELRRLKLKKNNWSSESYIFDEVFTESASQKRVYEAVAKPVVECVISGYNGTVMAYGQTGTGKTYTIGSLGKDNSSERGIMVRALEDVLTETSAGVDTLSVSYLQLYLESIQDLLAPDKNNIVLTKDTKSGEVCLLGATVVEIRDIDQFLEVLQIGEGNRHAANTKMNARSSRSHAILVVHIQRSLKAKDENDFLAVDMNKAEESSHNIKSKLLIIDLAGSERIDESGVDGQMLEEAKFINLSLNSLGKCINALAENCPHIPTRDSKLTRLLSDSFGGTARTSLLITVSPSASHYSQTSSTVMFGQRAMKVMNLLKLKEEHNSESKYRKLEYQRDHLISQVERQDKDKVQLERRLHERETILAAVERKLLEAEKKLTEATKKTSAVSEKKVEVMKTLVGKEQKSLGADVEKRLAELLELASKKLSEATKDIELLAEWQNHHSPASNGRAKFLATWFAFTLITLFSLLFIL
ncbi:Armadillo repeat-containing kinesin-like protein 1 [Platanthera guangdongensis]|uniref:Kinesin-like protein n=1 Tax=Platanthera guangdongensis TaxID=2320717 RepID=A0ABR2MD27_9ASPA